MVIAAHRVDKKRAALLDWSDEWFLVPEREPPRESTPEGTTKAQSCSARFLRLVPSLAGARGVFGLAVNEVLSGVFGSLCDTLWQLGMGVVDMIQCKHRDASLEVSARLSGGRLAMLLAIAARSAMQRTAHLNA
eukprot:6477630-Amphidinium_carterae.1